jgi:hypothetical protein
MNVAAMAIVALLVFAEKTLPVGRRLSQTVGVALTTVGRAIVLPPGLLPTTMRTPAEKQSGMRESAPATTR